MDEQLRNQLEKLRLSLKKLEEILSRNPEEDDIILDATIQRFEYTFENAWKTIKIFYKLQGLALNTPREAIKFAYKDNRIADEDAYLNLLQARNLTSHTYSLEIAQSVYNTIKQHYNSLAHIYTAFS